MLEVYCTLTKSLNLWRRYFWLITIITLVTEVPNVLMRCWIAVPAHSHFLGQLIRMTDGFLIGPLFYAANTSAVLGLLAKSDDRETSLNAILKSVQSNTWTMYRLFWLMVLIVFAAMIPVWLIAGCFTKFFGMTKLIPFFLISVYLLLIKYALANPLVVAEKMEASPALNHSWTMTKGHFWYVAGCYLSLGISVWLLRWVVYSIINGRPYDFINPNPFAEILLVFVGPLSIIFSWCMYHEIKTMDTASVVSER